MTVPCYTVQLWHSIWCILGKEELIFICIKDKHSGRALVLALKEFTPVPHLFTVLIFSAGRGHWLVARKGSLRESPESWLRQLQLKVRKARGFLLRLEGRKRVSTGKPIRTLLDRHGHRHF